MQLSGFVELNNKLENLVKQYPEKRDQFLAQEAETMLGRAKSETPVDTGRLKGGWHRTKPVDGSIDVYNNTEYANHVEYGHRVRGSDRLVPGCKMLHKAMLTTKRNFKSDAEGILGGLFQ